MIRLAVLPDFPEEKWPSMDLCAEMLQENLPAASLLMPHFRQVCSRLPVLGRRRIAFNGDRLLNRFVVYPRFVKRRRDQFDFFHVVDHSYAQLVHALPAERTAVFCHDLDAFRCLLDPAHRRPRWFRALARRALHGMQKTAVVFHSTMATRAEIERYGLIDPNRLIHAPYGVSPEFTADGPSETRLGRYILHVGSNSPRKRIDVLLRTFAGVRRDFPDLRLVKVGPPFSAAQLSMISEYKLGDAVVRREGLTRAEIAAFYRGAAAVLLPSDAEGFGLPVIEALACGAPVLASDLPTLREVGGSAVEFVPVGDVESWVAAVKRVIERPNERPRLVTRLQQASRFTWAEHARIIHDAYVRLSRGQRPAA